MDKWVKIAMVIGGSAVAVGGVYTIIRAVRKKDLDGLGDQGDHKWIKIYKSDKGYEATLIRRAEFGIPSNVAHLPRGYHTRKEAVDAALAKWGEDLLVRGQLNGLGDSPDIEAHFTEIVCHMNGQERACRLAKKDRHISAALLLGSQVTNASERSHLEAIRCRLARSQPWR